MDKTVLINKYLDCAKLLVGDTLPENFADILYDDVIHNTKLFADELKSKQQKLKSERKHKRWNAGVRNDQYDTRSRTGGRINLSEYVAESTPVVVLTSYTSTETPPIHITRSVARNGIASIEDGNQQPQEIQQTSKSGIPQKESSKPPARRHRVHSLRSIESDDSDSNEVSHQEMPNRKKSKIYKKENSKPTAYVRRIICADNINVHPLAVGNPDLNEANMGFQSASVSHRRNSDRYHGIAGSCSNEVSRWCSESAKRTSFGRSNSVRPARTTASYQADSDEVDEVNVFNRTFTDGCIIS